MVVFAKGDYISNIFWNLFFGLNMQLLSLLVFRKIKTFSLAPEVLWAQDAVPDG